MKDQGRLLTGAAYAAGFKEKKNLSFFTVSGQRPPPLISKNTIMSKQKTEPAIKA